MSEELFKYQKELDELTNLSTGTLRKITSSLSDFEQTYKFLEAKKKSYIADMMSLIWLSNPKLSKDKCETMALSSKEFKEFLEGYKDSLKEYINFKYKYETIINRIEILRSFISLEKEKLSLR